MTDKETLLSYRLSQAEETLNDAKKMLENKLSPRSIVNRSYYSIFYSILALFLNSNIQVKTSKNIGIISIFDKEFIHTGKIDKHFSKILHYMFKIRQECDYKELIQVSNEDALEAFKKAEEFLYLIKKVIS